MDSISPDFFSWIVPDALAAMAWPRELRRDLEYLKEKEIDVIITLTERTLAAAMIEEFGFEWHHLAMADFTAPDGELVCRFVEIVNQARKAKRKTVVHCLAGRGRTGTMAACYLVNQGYTSMDALREIRRLRPGSIETAEQEEAVHDYALRLGRSQE